MGRGKRWEPRASLFLFSVAIVTRGLSFSLSPASLRPKEASAEERAPATE